MTGMLCEGLHVGNSADKTVYMHTPVACSRCNKCIHVIHPWNSVQAHTFMADFCSRPARTLSRVDLPAPGGPSSSVMRPGRNVPLMSSRMQNCVLLGFMSPTFCTNACHGKGRLVSTATYYAYRLLAIDITNKRGNHCKCELLCDSERLLDSVQTTSQDHHRKDWSMFGLTIGIHNSCHPPQICCDTN